MTTDNTRDEPDEIFGEFKELSDKWMAWEQGWQAGMDAAHSFRATGQLWDKENPFKRDLMEFLRKHKEEGVA